jgi:hypothetical protein
MADTTYTIILRDSGIKAFTMPRGYWPDVEIQCWGAGGGAGRGGAQGGGGGYAKVTVNIYEGDEVSLQIGQPGGNASGMTGGSPGLDTTYRLFRGGRGGNAYDEDNDSGASGGGGGASWVAVNGTYVCAGAGGGGAGGLGDDGAGRPGNAGLPGGVYVRLNTRPQGADAYDTGSPGGGSGGGYPYGGAQTPGYGDDAGAAPGGNGGQNYGNVTVVGSGIFPGGKTASLYPGLHIAEAGYPGYITIVLRKKLNIYNKNPDASGDWVNIQSAYVKVGEARPSVVSDTRTFNTIGSSTYVIPNEIRSLTISYVTPSGIVSQIIPVTPGGVLPVTVGDVGQASSFGEFTMPPNNKQVFQYIGNVDHLLNADVQIANASGNPLTTAGYNAGQTAAAAAAGLIYNVTYEGWHGDLYSTLNFNPIATGNLSGKFRIVAGGGGRAGAPAITAQPTLANGYVMSIQFYDGGGGEGAYNGTFTLQQQGNFTISYDLPIVITPWKQIQQAFTKVSDQWLPILTNKTIDLYNYPVKRIAANIIISSNTSSYDLYDNIPVTYFEGLMDIDVWVLPGVIVSGSTSSTAFTITGFTSGDRVTLHNYGTIIGLGGSGGSGSYTYQQQTSSGKGGFGGFGKGGTYSNTVVVNAVAGSDGGSGLLLGTPVLLLNDGVIAGGGGGGGGGGQSAGGRGGGGAGYGPGANNGTASAGGAGAGNAGAGGGPGSPGASGAGSSAASGGKPGYAIQGSSYILPESNFGTFSGPVAG